MLAVNLSAHIQTKAIVQTVKYFIMLIHANCMSCDISRFLKASFRREAQHASATTAAAEQHRQELENLKSQSSLEAGGSLMKQHEIA